MLDFFYYVKMLFSYYLNFFSNYSHGTLHLDLGSVNTYSIAASMLSEDTPSKVVYASRFRAQRTHFLFMSTYVEKDNNADE